ncbi:putative transcription factor bHLH041 [Brassica napus]|uniref:putative transcription factor bHLH041 n=1 Tax=Brassica napus TaxID=3708 RepID=UPI00207A29C5|nr:putative transcription factor bHLH041 [Brassica napus]
MKIGESLREWFPQDFIRKSSPPNSDYLRPQPPPSSSSSSFRSVDSPQNISEFSSPLFPLFPEPSTTTDDAVNVLLHSLLAPVTSTPTGNMIHQQQQESLFRNSKREEEAITKAILAVLTTSSTPPSTSSPPLRKRRATAFKRYYCMDNGGGGSGRAPSSVRKQSMSRRAISFYTRLNIYRRERFARASSTTSGGGDRSGPTATQLHHMISERRRREKLNESFLALRSLLPQGTKVRDTIFLFSLYKFLLHFYLSSLTIQYLIKKN